MWNRLCTNWVYGGFLAGLLLLALTPLLTAGWSAALLLVFLQLPIYMLHQYEEHDHDRFRHMVNELMGHGKEVLTPGAVFIINIPGVWGVNVLSIWLAAHCGIGWGLIGIYLTLVNGVAHIAQGFARRSYNPGLATSLLLFLPVGIWALATVISTHQVTELQQVVGLGSALLIHAAIIGHVKLQARRLAH